MQQHKDMGKVASLTEKKNLSRMIERWLNKKGDVEISAMLDVMSVSPDFCTLGKDRRDNILAAVLKWMAENEQILMDGTIIRKKSRMVQQ